MISGTCFVFANIYFAFVYNASLETEYVRNGTIFYEKSDKKIQSS